MAITKLGQDLTLPKYLAQGFLNAFRRAKRVSDATVSPLGKIVGNRAAGLTSKALGSIVKGVSGVGKFIYNKPHIAVPMAAMGYLATKGAYSNFAKNMYHVYPRYGITHSNALGQIKYTRPENKKSYEDLNVLNI